MIFRKQIALLATLIVMAVPTAAMIIEFSLEDMVGGSESIVQGQVVVMDAHWSDGPTRIIVTDVRIRVDEVWMGAEQPGEFLDLQVAGGEVGGMGMKQEHAPTFVMDEQVVLFLWTLDTGQLSIFNDEQGKYRIVNSQVVNFKREVLDLAEFRETIERAITWHGR